MKIENGVLVDVYNDDITNGTCTLPDNITSIGRKAFSGCTNLTEITLPNSITSIDKEAFSGCTSLTEITLPNSITSIGIRAFSDCTSLTVITLPNRITSIALGAFWGCTNLTEINLPNSITSIAREAFSRTSLTEITLPNSIISIDIMAFLRCTNLTQITLSNNITSIAEGVFWGCTNLKKIIIIAKNTTEFIRIRSYLPIEEQVKAQDPVNFHINTIKSFLDTTEDSKNKQNLLDKVNSSIEALQSLIESHEGLKELQLELNSYVIKIYLQQNDLEGAKEYLELHPNLPIGVAFDLAATIFAGKEVIKLGSDMIESNEDSTIRNKQFIKLFMEYYQDPDVRTLLKKSAFSLLSGEQANLDSDLTRYGIDQCLPLSAVLSVIDSIADESLKKWLDSIKGYLPLFTINEMHLFLSIPLLKKAFEQTHQSINMITYESLINLQNVKDVKTYTHHEKTDIEYIKDTINNKIASLKEKPGALVHVPRLSIFQPERNLDNNRSSSDSSHDLHWPSGGNG